MTEDITLRESELRKVRDVFVRAGWVGYTTLHFSSVDYRPLCRHSMFRFVIRLDPSIEFNKRIDSNRIRWFCNKSAFRVVTSYACSVSCWFIVPVTSADVIVDV